MNSGLKSILQDAFGWAFLAIASAVALMHFQEIKQFTNDLLDYPVMGNTPSGQGGAPSNRTGEVSDEIPYGLVRLRRSRGGHYLARAKINNRQIRVMVDTGATLVALTFEDARRAGINVSSSDFTSRSRTANGIARSARVNIRSLRIGNITLRNVKASVSRPGALHVTLLGMSFLGRLSRVEMRDGDLVLQK